MPENMIKSFVFLPGQLSSKISALKHVRSFSMSKRLLSVCGSVTLCFCLKQDVLSQTRGGGCADTQPGVERCAIVYKVQMTLNLAEGKTRAAEYDPCAEGTQSVCYREPAKTSLKGFIYGCDCFLPSICGGELFVTLWEPHSRKYRFFESDCFFYQFHVIGRNANKAELIWDSNHAWDEIICAGIGSYDTEARRLKNASGLLVGNQEYVLCTVSACEELTAPAYQCDGSIAPVYKNYSNYYGTWKLIYSKTLSEKYAENGRFIYSLFPDFENVWGAYPLREK
jgi:hypothetical protein